MRVRSVLVLPAMLLLAAMCFVAVGAENPPNAGAGSEGGSPVGDALAEGLQHLVQGTDGAGARAQDVPPDLPYGTRVQAIVDGPADSPCIQAGDTGTIYCYVSDPTFPFPYLVNWDVPCGYPQSQVCGIEAPNGWWVHEYEISELGCAASAVANGAASEGRVPQTDADRGLDIARAFRDNVMNRSELGLELTGLYYEHSPEILQILRSNPRLYLRASEIFFQIIPVIKSSMEVDGTIVITRELMARIQRLADELEALAEPELAASIDEVQSFVNRNVRSAGREKVRIDLAD